LRVCLPIGGPSEPRLTAHSQPRTMSAMTWVHRSPVVSLLAVAALLAGQVMACAFPVGPAPATKVPITTAGVPAKPKKCRCCGPKAKPAAPTQATPVSAPAEAPCCPGCPTGCACCGAKVLALPVTVASAGAAPHHARPLTTAGPTAPPAPFDELFHPPRA
jgi:hypothetical protein